MVLLCADGWFIVYRVQFVQMDFLAHTVWNWVQLDFLVHSAGGLFCAYKVPLCAVGLLIHNVRCWIV